MKYGDLFIEGTSGKAKVGVKYGDMKVNDLANGEIYLGYGKGYIEKMGKANVEMKYSEFTLDEAEEMKISTKYSDLELGAIGNMEINTGYDDLEIESVYAIDCESNYTVVEIGKVEKEIIIDLNYGGLEVDYVNSDFNAIDIRSNYAGIELEIDKDASYYLEVDMKYGSLEYPEAYANINRYEKSHTSDKYKGTISRDKNPQSRITIETYHADVEISNY